MLSWCHAGWSHLARLLWACPVPCLCNVHLEPAWPTCLVRCVLRGLGLNNLQGCPSAAVSGDPARLFVPSVLLAFPVQAGYLLFKVGFLIVLLFKFRPFRTRGLQQALLRRARASGQSQFQGTGVRAIVSKIPRGSRRFVVDKVEHDEPISQVM